MSFNCLLQITFKNLVDVQCKAINYWWGKVKLKSLAIHKAGTYITILGLDYDNNRLVIAKKQYLEYILT